MRTIQRGDIVKVNGYNNGRQATVLRVESPNDIVVKMGIQSLHVPLSMLAVVSRNRHDENGKVKNPQLQVGDRVKYTYPDTVSDIAMDAEAAYKKRPVRYGVITEIISQKRVAVIWDGSDTEKAERISRLKWVPNIPQWFSSKTRIDDMADPMNPDQGPEYE